MHSSWVRRVFLFLLLALFLLPLSGCTVPVLNQELCLPPSVPLLGGNCNSSPSSTGKNVNLTYWGLWEPKEVFQPLIEAYQQQHPQTKIDYQPREIERYFETVLTHLKEGMAPDIIRVHNTWVPYLRPYLSSIPEDVLSISEYEQRFYPVTKETLFRDGKYYALPLEVDTLGLIYNRSLFTQAGITQPPRTWDEFKVVSKKLTKKDATGNIIQAGAAIGFTTGIEHFNDLLGLLMAQNQVQFQNAQGQLIFHLNLSAQGDNLAADVLSFYRLFQGENQVWNPAWPSAIEAFAQGKVAMIFAPSFRILDILALNPRLPLATAPVPQLTNNVSQQVNWASYWVEVVAKNSPHQEQAWQFLKFLTERENLKLMFQTASPQYRPFGEPYPRPDMADELSRNSYLQPFVQQATNAVSWNFVDGTQDRILNDRIKEILQTELNKNLPLEETLNKMAEQISIVISNIN